MPQIRPAVRDRTTRALGQYLLLLVTVVGAPLGRHEAILSADCSKEGAAEGLGLLQHAKGRGLSQAHGEAGSSDATATGASIQQAAMREERGAVHSPSEGAGAGKKRFAFVTMSHTPPGQEEETIWGVLAIAAAIRRLSQYPLVLLTNGTQFADGTSYREAFSRLHVQLLPVYPIETTSTEQSAFIFERFEFAFWKLQIWKLTQFDKLMWLDADTILYRGVDWIFQREGMWAQTQDYYCRRVYGEGPCSGAFSLEPNEHDYYAMLALAQNVTMVLGDQSLISAYHTNVKKKPINLLRFVDADWGRCVTRVPPAFRDAAGNQLMGLWSIPAIIHKSGGVEDKDDPCFSPKIARQLYTVGNATINVCQYSPLGVHWRDLFCQAAHRELGLKVPEVLSFCNDACWYGDTERLPPEARTWGAGVVCTPNTTTDLGLDPRHMSARRAEVVPEPSGARP